MRAEGNPCQGPPLVNITDHGNNATPSPREQSVTPDNRDDSTRVDNTSMETDDIIPAAQPPTIENIDETLDKKRWLRKRLLCAEHHPLFLQKCNTEGLTPKGLNLNKQIHPIRD